MKNNSKTNKQLCISKIFKNTKIVKGFLMALLDLKEYEIKKLKLQIHLHWEKMMKKKKEFWTSN